MYKWLHTVSSPNKQLSDKVHLRSYFVDAAAKINNDMQLTFVVYQEYFNSISQVQERRSYCHSMKSQ